MKSHNGWPASDDRAEIPIKTFTVKGTDVVYLLEVNE